MLLPKILWRSLLFSWLLWIFHASLMANRPPAIPEKQFEKILRMVSVLHVEPFSEAHLYEKAVQGMLSACDPHSTFLGPNSLKALTQHLENSMVGIGVHLEIQDQMVKIVSVIPGGSAEKAGLKSGDLITHVENKWVGHLTFDEVIGIMRGKEQSALKLKVITKATGNIQDHVLIRKKIDLPQVSHSMPTPHIGVIQISLFNASTASKVQAQLKKLAKKPQLRALILDLRNSPGGSLPSAIDTTNLFLDSQTLAFEKNIVTLHARRGHDKIYKASGKDQSKRIPLAVLINAGSASASEILAAALKDHGRAIILGEQSFGKGSVQTVIPLEKNTALKLTTALYRSPSGAQIQGQGVRPHIQLPNQALTPAPKRTLRERDLQHSLKQHTLVETPSPPVFIPEHILATQDLARSDYQLASAVSVMQTAIMQPKSRTHAEVFGK